MDNHQVATISATLHFSLCIGIKGNLPKFRSHTQTEVLELMLC